jgi:hypothetical protein
LQSEQKEHRKPVGIGLGCGKVVVDRPHPFITLFGVSRKPEECKKPF